MKHSPIARKTPMARTGWKRTAPGAGAGLLRVAAAQRESRTRKRMKSRGTKGRAPTVAERARMDMIAGLGCIACRHDGIVNPWISLHHIDGRTKPGAHMRVLPLCAPHHQQDDTDVLQRPSVHGRKETFVARYGTEQELLAKCLQLIGEPVCGQ